MRFQIRQRADGAYDVIDITTGQIRYTGSLAGARNAQATLIAWSYL